VINAIPAPLLPERDGISIEQEAGWAPGPVWKTSAPLRFDNWTVQLLAIRYIDYAITPLPSPPSLEEQYEIKISNRFATLEKLSFSKDTNRS